MDHVVHINNGSGAARPIVLRLLPGEETIFNLKVVNHGKPSNISLQASNPVFKAVRLKKPDHFVVMEEIIPILARMPANKKRLDGEILLSGSGGESRVPITLLRDSEDPGDDLEDPSLQGDEELKDDLMGEAREREDTSNDGDEEEDEDADLAPRRIDGKDRGDADYEGEDEEDTERIKPVKRPEDEYEEGDEEKEKEPRRIVFSRDKDLQRYRSATSQRRVAGAPESRGEKRTQKPAGKHIDRDRGNTESVENRYYGNSEGSSDLKGNDLNDNRNQDLSSNSSDRNSNAQIDPGKENEIESTEDDDNSRVTARYKVRIDDRFVDKSNKQDEIPRFIPRQTPLGEQEERQENRPEERLKATSGYEDSYQGLRQEQDSESREIIASAEREERVPGEQEAYAEKDEMPQSAFLDKLDGFGAFGTLQVIPVVLFLALVTVLVLTFITENIPEFPGALASSILIVTLIIYGAATLLKA